LADNGDILTDQDELFIRNPDFVFRRIIDETILVPIHRNLAEMDCIYTLNELGALLWEKLSVPTSRTELCQVILDNYDTNEEAASVDLEAFLDELQAIGALQKA